MWFPFHTNTIGSATWILDPGGILLFTVMTCSGPSRESGIIALLFPREILIVLDGGP